jgi:uncharacterized membrane protein
LERKTNTALHNNNKHVLSIVVQVDTVYIFYISYLPKACLAVSTGEVFKVQDRGLFGATTITKRSRNGIMQEALPVSLTLATRNGNEGIQATEVQTWVCVFVVVATVYVTCKKRVHKKCGGGRQNITA